MVILGAIQRNELMLLFNHVWPLEIRSVNDPIGGTKVGTIEQLVE